MLATNFRDYAIVLTQLELQDEAFSTVELYSECGRGRGGLPAVLGLRPPGVPALKEPSGLAAAPLHHSSLHEIPTGAPSLPSLSPPPRTCPLWETWPCLEGGTGWELHVVKGLGVRRAQGPRCLSGSCCGPPARPRPPARLSGGTSPAGRTELASQKAMGLFTKWSKGLGFSSQQQATLQKDRECHRA